MDEVIEVLFSYSRWIGGGALVLIIVGVAYRRVTRVHVPIMLAAFVIDMLNVLLIELNRDAVKRTMETAGVAGEWILKFHILVSVISVVCYVIALITGPLLLLRRRCRTAHRWNAIVFLVCRSINFVTSFWV